MSCTGYLYENLPDSPERDEALGLVRFGLQFKQQHCGRRRGYLFNSLVNLSRQIKPLTFEKLLDELAYQSRRRELLGEKASPFEKVDRDFELLTFHDPKKGRIQMPFGTLRNYFTNIKKELFPLTTKP